MDMLYSSVGKTEIHCGLTGDCPDAPVVVLDGFTLYPPGDARWERLAQWGYGGRVRADVG